MDECLNNPCKNEGACVNTIGGFSCKCRQGYKGALCDEGTFVVKTAPWTFVDKYVINGVKDGLKFPYFCFASRLITWEKPSVRFNSTYWTENKINKIDLARLNLPFLLSVFPKFPEVVHAEWVSKPPASHIFLTSGFSQLFYDFRFSFFISYSMKSYCLYLTEVETAWQYIGDF